MRNASTNSLLDASAHYERATTDLDLLFSAVDRDSRLSERYKPDALKRIHTELREIPRHFLDKQRAHRTDPFLNREGQQHAELQAARTAWASLDAFEANTVGKLQAQETKRRTDFLTPKRAADPIEAITQELRNRELRDRLAGMDRSLLEAKLRADDDVALAWLPAIESAPVGFDIVRQSVLSEVKASMAERLDPEIGELAGLRGVYSYAVGVARQSVLVAAGLDATAIAAATPAVDTRSSYVLGGQDVTR